MQKLRLWWAKQNPLSKYFYYFLLCFTFIIIVAGGFQSYKKIPYKDNLVYKQSQKIYFNNIRSFYYNKIQDDLSGFDKYYLRRGSWDTAQSGFHWVILDNMLTSEAYIYPNFYGINARYPEYAFIRFGDSIKYKIYPQNADSLRFIAYQIMQNIDDDKREIKLVLPQDEFLLYSDKNQRKNTQTVLEDYFKWTE